MDRHDLPVDAVYQREKQPAGLIQADQTDFSLP